MLFNPSILTASTLVTLAAATVTPYRRNEPTTPTDVQCCASTGTAGSSPVAAVLKGLGIAVEDPSVLVGLQCSPITVVGNGGACGGTTTAVTCTDNTHGGLVDIGCVPVDLATAAPRRRGGEPTKPPPAPGTECCGSTGTAGQEPFATILKGLGIDVQDLGVGVGVDCSPITVIGGSATCGGGTTAVTCTDNSHTLISVGCVPVTLAMRAAAPLPRGGEPTNPAPAGSECCGSTGTAGEEPFSTLLGLLGIDVSDLNVGVGVQCSPITVIGDVSPCSASGGTAVTCTDNSHTAISVGCVPLSV